jgi:uncharacterized protein
MPPAIPSLIGVIHLPPLPGSPRWGGDVGAVVASAARDARILAEAGFDGILVENFGDAPFVPDSTGPATTAKMTACALAARAAAPGASLGINVLRNDAEAAIAAALAAGAQLVRINVHTGARVTDQGLIQGMAHRTLRMQRSIGAGHLRLLCDVDVKHSAPLASRPLADEARDLVERGLADAVLVTGGGTGQAVAASDLEQVLAAVDVPVLVASGVTVESLGSVQRAHGVIVGSCLRLDGRAGGAVDRDRAQSFADAFRKMHGSSPAMPSL